MGTFVRPTRPLAQLVAGAATAGAHYRTDEQSEKAYGEEMREVYETSRMMPPPQYTPTGSQIASRSGDLEAVRHLHEIGVLTDDEFNSATAKLLGA